MPPGRLVWNHSTHISGLIPVLEKLTQQPEITTVTPGVLGRTKGRSPHLQLRVSVPINGGYKLQARKGSSVQEVFVLTTLDKEPLQALIQALLA